MYNSNTVVVYQGPSEIDGERVMVLLSGIDNGSANRKTGGMLQTWILREDVAPWLALQLGADKSICGGCPLRPKVAVGEGGKVTRACYVRVDQAPTNMYKTYQRGRYETVTLEQASALCAGQLVRLGAYGDPAAVPITVWEALLRFARGHTGYTHQWKAKKFNALQRYCQASVDTDEEQVKAAAEGWGTFQVRPQGNVLQLTGQHLCPASAEAGHRLTCEQCLRCAGTSAGQQHIMIPAHGSGAKHVTGLTRTRN